MVRSCAFALAVGLALGAGAVLAEDSPVPVPRPEKVRAKAAAVDAAPARIDRSIPARKLFAGKDKPAPLEARSIGSYARGCLAGGKALAVDGPAWQVMRLSRNRNWGHPNLIAFLERLAADAPGLGWRGLLVGDLAQPRGGPMLTGHASHQIGLDADIWLREMPDRKLSKKEREDLSSISMLVDGTRRIDKSKWTDGHARLIRRAASDPGLARIFVHPAIKKALCDWADGDRDWLRRVRPWYGHHYHFHVRLSCPKGLATCKNQAPPPPGDGCGESLSWWLSDAPWRRAKPDKKTKFKEVMLSDLPDACAGVLAAR